MKHKIVSFCLILLMTCAVVLTAQAQNMQTFRGRVVDTKGEPIIGASIKVMGTTTGAFTDLEGRFYMSVPENSKIEISYLGYATLTVTDLKEKHFVMKEDALMLDEAVAVGYGIQKKAHLTGAISTVNMDDVKDLSSTDLSSSLRGLVPGLSVSGGDGRPGEQARLNVRQSATTSSLSNVSGFVAYTGPLYVIDGFISDEASFNNLDASMVENISVLKDGAAAVYGARSANGVIVVTTKRGEVGKPKISYSGQFGYTDEVSRTKMLNSYDYGKIWNGVYAAPASEGVTNQNLQKDLFQADELEAMKKLNYDILEREWSAAITQKHSVNMGGGTENANYFAGISYNTQGGNLGKLDYERWNYRAGVDLKINTWIKATLQLSGDYGKQRKAYNIVGGSSPETDYNNLLTRPRYIPEYVDGRPIAAYGPTNTFINNSQYYHYDVIQKSDNHSQNANQNMVVNSSLEYDLGWSKLFKGLKIRFSYSKSIGTTKNNEKGTQYTLYDMIMRGGSRNHLYTGDNLNLDESNFGIRNVSNGNQLKRTMTRSDAYQMNFSVNYTRTFGDHNVTGLFSIEKTESESENLSGAVTDPYPFTNGQSNTARGDKNTDFGRSESGQLSYIGRANYMYKNRYLLEFLIRSDASTKFAPRNYWGVFPSLSAGWIMSEENWFRNNVKFVNHLKVRGSFGLLGRDNIDAWAWMRTYSLDPDKGPIFGPGTGVISGPHTSLNDNDINPNSHWDKSYKANFGIDFGMLNNRLSANIDGYYEWNRDVFSVRTGDFVPSTTGVQAAAENFASMENYGIEISMKWSDRIGKDFKYSVGINTGYSDNKVTKQFWKKQIGLNELHPGQRKDTGSWGYLCLGMFRSYQEIEEYFDRYNITTYMGMSKDAVRPGMLIYKDIRTKQNPDGSYTETPDGVVDEHDKVQISNRSNPYGMTVNLRAEWKGISLSAQIGGNWGGYDYVPKLARSIGSLTSSASGYTVMQYVNLPSFWADNMFVYSNITDAQQNVVVEANRFAKYPNLRYPVNAEESTFWKVNGTRVALRTITVAYTIPRHIVNKIGIESCRLNLTGQNLFSFYNPYPDHFMDPLAGSYGIYPNLRKFTLGLNVSF